jgi:hypothetical protein
VALLVVLFLYFRRKRADKHQVDDYFEQIPAPTSMSAGGGTRGLASLSPVQPRQPSMRNAYADDRFTQAINTHHGDYGTMGLASLPPMPPPPRNPARIADNRYGNIGLASLPPVFPTRDPDDRYAHATHLSDNSHEAEHHGMEYPPGTIYTTQQHQHQRYQNAFNASFEPRATSPTSSSSHHLYPNPFDPSSDPPSPSSVRNSSIAYGIPHESQDSFYGASD